MQNVLHIEERKEVNDQEFKNIKQPLEAKPDYMPVEKANENNDDQEFMNTDQLFEDEQDHKPVEERKGIGQQVPIIIQELLKVESESTPVAGYSEQIAAVEQRNAAMDFLERVSNKKYQKHYLLFLIFLLFFFFLSCS